MIRDIVRLLKETDSKDPIIARAKGVNKYPSNFRDLANYIKLKYKHNG